MISNIYEFLDKSVAKYPNKTLFVSGKNCINYLEFSHKSSALASKILEFGLNKSQF
ncbi:amino acid adenylation domain-containing protein [Campylobacter devanensis]|nr:amino acid adenylation domain-containing protein [Campylobacter lanienae]